jgi:ABC-type branched-subunit amino acid transport system permease subunit
MTQQAPPSIGVDSWVAEAEERREGGRIRQLFERVPPGARFGAFLVGAALVPLLSSNEYVIRVGVDTLIFALLALGLNVVVGFSGLLDLGYIAFYGFGAYMYALIASDKFGIHWPAEAALPVILLAAGVVGLLLGLPSRRLLGDYLAIVTLFFGLAFVTFVTNGNRLTLFGHSGAVDLTSGPNGISDLDPLEFFGQKVVSIQAYFYVSLITLAIVVIALHFTAESRTGRAWKALREDPLAAETMSIPVNRLKLLAFAFGASIAGVTGAISAAVDGAVFPDSYDTPLLITVYAMVILGGAGSLSGVILGALTINISLEVLRDPNQARWLFYSVILISLIAKVRPWKKLAAILGGLVAFGFAFHALIAAVWPAGTKGQAAGGDVIGRAVQGWVIRPEHNATLIGNYAFVALIACVLILTVLHGWWRALFLVPTLYLAAFVWENRLDFEPSTTRLIILGALLIVLMNARPQGLLGTSRVEIV